MEEILGAMAGALVPVAVQWSRYDDQTQQRVRTTKYDLRDLKDAWQESQGWGSAVRGRLPIVMDWGTGLAMATAQTATPQAIPSLPPGQLRPNLCQGAEAFVSAMLYPPRAGVYDARHNVQQLGELSTTALAMTFEEVRAAIHGLILCNGSTATQRVAIYRSVNALVETVAALGLTKAQFAEAWAKVFTPTVTTAPIDPHRDPSRPPTITSVNAGNNVASVAFLPSGGNGEINAQTDMGHRMRITAGAGGPIGVGLEVATITFATPYRYRRADGSTATMQPQVHIQSTSQRRVFAIALSTGYTIVLGDLLAATEMLDVSVIVEPGVTTV